MNDESKGTSAAVCERQTPGKLRSPGATAPGPRRKQGRGAVIHGAVVAALGGLLFGFDTAVISGTTDTLKRIFSLNEFWLGFTVAVALIGTVIGSFAIGQPADRFGRKKALYALATLYLVSALGCAIAPNWTLLLVARFLGGLAVGGASVVAPMYIAEISPSHLRGRLVAVSQVNVITGILLSYVSNYIVAQCFSEDVAWRWMLGVMAVPASLFFLLIFGIKESPRWLVRVGRMSDARNVLLYLGESEVDRELAEIRASLADASGQSQGRLFQKRYSKSILLAWAVATFNQLTGINALLYYAPAVFKMAGAGKSSALGQSVAIGVDCLIFTLAALFIIDRFGRRVLMLVGSLGTALCLSLASWQFSLGTAANGPLLLAALLGYIAFFAFSQGAVIWVFISEIFPNAVRAKGQALGSFTHWYMAAAVTWIFPVVAKDSAAPAFGFFAAMMLLQFVFALKFMPETKGGTLEQIEQRLAGGGRG